MRRIAAVVRAIPVVRRVVPVVHRAVRTARRLPMVGPAVVRWTRPEPVRTATVVAPPRRAVTANLRGARWIDPGVFEVRGWAYLDGVPSEEVEIVVVAQSPAGQRLRFDTDQHAVDEVNLVAKDPVLDRRDAAFTARLDLAEQARTFPAVNFEQSWEVDVVLRRRGGDAQPPAELARTPFTTYFKLGSAHLFQAENVGSDLLVRPMWRRGHGLVLVAARRAAVLSEIAMVDGRLHFGVATTRFAAVRAQVTQDPEPTIDLAAVDSSDPMSLTFELDLADLHLEPAGSAYLLVTNQAGSTRHVHWSGSNRSSVLTDPAHPELRVICAPSGVVRIDRVTVRLEVRAVTVDESGEVPMLVLTGRSAGVADLALELHGPRNILLPVRVDQVDAAPLVEFVARFALITRHPWHTRDTAVRQGVYRLNAIDSAGAVLTSARVATELGEQLALRCHLDLVHLRVERTTGGLFQVRVEPAKVDAEHGAFNQARHIAAFRSDDHQVVDCVYYESFNGRSAGDNTLAIAQEVTRRRPDLPAYWAVADHSVEVPSWATPLLIHSAPWWDLLASARYVVSNNWLAGASVRRPYQTVLQAWHGTPLKTLGIDRFEADEPQKVARMQEMSSIWDMLISQNAYSTAIFRRCYVYDGSVLDIGYPRNDVLTNGLPEDTLSQLRAGLGLRDGQKVALYMPTWREDTKQLFAELDFGELMDGIGEDWVLLVRGHTNTQKHGRTVASRSVIDVTMYPDPAALYLLADVLITDYSSVMFDFSITGKPMVFFTPDLERYETSLRGVYFSLPRKAPGPLLNTTAAVVEAIRDLDQVVASHVSRYAKWRAEFNPWDDGRAAERAVDALLAHVPESG